MNFNPPHNIFVDVLREELINLNKLRKVEDVSSYLIRRQDEYDFLFINLGVFIR